MFSILNRDVPPPLPHLIDIEGGRVGGKGAGVGIEAAKLARGEEGRRRRGGGSNKAKL